MDEAYIRALSRQIPAGTGYEAVGPPAGPQAAAEAQYKPGMAPGSYRNPWTRLRTRILGSEGMSAAQWLAEWELRRRQYDPDLVIPRPLIVSEIITGALNGNNPLVWTFPTLGIVTGISAQVYQAPDGEDIGNFLISVRAGSDGGFIIGETANPASLGALANLPAVESGVHRSLQPTTCHPNNNWTGTLIGAGLTGDPFPNVHITFYGVNLWQPSGQIL